MKPYEVSHGRWVLKEPEDPSYPKAKIGQGHEIADDGSQRSVVFITVRWGPGHEDRCETFALGDDGWSGEAARLRDALEAAGLRMEP